MLQPNSGSALWIVSRFNRVNFLENSYYPINGGKQHINLDWSGLSPWQTRPTKVRLLVPAVKNARSKNLRARRRRTGEKNRRNLSSPRQVSNAQSRYPDDTIPRKRYFTVNLAETFSRLCRESNSVCWINRVSRTLFLFALFDSKPWWRSNKMLTDNDWNWRGFLVHARVKTCSMTCKSFAMRRSPRLKPALYETLSSLPFLSPIVFARLNTKVRETGSQRSNVDCSLNGEITSLNYYGITKREIWIGKFLSQLRFFVSQIYLGICINVFWSLQEYSLMLRERRVLLVSTFWSMFRMDQK